MGFQFMHSKIDTRSSVPSLADIVKRSQVKTASSKFEKNEEEDDNKEKGKEVDGDEDGEENKAFPGAAPKFKKKESKASTKVAEKDSDEGKSSGQPEAEDRLVNKPKNPEGSKSTGGKGKGKGGESDEAESSGQLDVEPLHQEGESTGEKPGDLDTMKDNEGKIKVEKQKEASSQRFVRIAELTDKQKEFLRATWSMYWPKSFIDALLATK